MDPNIMKRYRVIFSALRTAPTAYNIIWSRKALRFGSRLGNAESLCLATRHLSRDTFSPPHLGHVKKVLVSLPWTGLCRFLQPSPPNRLAQSQSRARIFQSFPSVRSLLHVVAFDSRHHPPQHTKHQCAITLAEETVHSVSTEKLFTDLPRRADQSPSGDRYSAGAQSPTRVATIPASPSLRRS